MTAAAPTYPSRAAAARALGITPRRLTVLAGRGAPVPAEGPIPAQPLCEWALAHREALAARGDLSEQERRLRLATAQLAHAAAAKTHLAEAQRLVARVLAQARDAVRADLGGPAMARLLAAAAEPPAAAGPRIAAEVLALIDGAMQRALR